SGPEEKSRAGALPLGKRASALRQPVRRQKVAICSDVVKMRSRSSMPTQESIQGALMKLSLRLLPALLLVSAAASAVNVPLPVEGATLNVNVQLQPWAQVAEDAPSPNVGEQFYMRRARLILQGNFSKEWLYLINLDSPNFGLNGNYTGRMLLQDAWI